MQLMSFASDYEEGAHPAILERLSQTNLQKTPGYGTDEYCAAARKKIRDACSCPEAAVYFLMGGTQTNATVIGALLRPYQGVVAAETGHICLHEGGAIEHGGHKVLPLPQKEGKLSAAEVERFCAAWKKDENRDHMVAPGMVYLSQPTEYGTLYSLEELIDLRAVCDRYALPLYVDGARLAYALACKSNDVTLQDLARLCDVFYIGGTKCGALFGEALVVPNPQLLPGFFTVCKQNGAVLAKGRLLGLQFDTLFTNNLYRSIGGAGIRAAERMRSAFLRAGYRLALESPTNQIFVLLENNEMERLAELVGFSYWESADPNHTVVRFASSWATTRDQTDRLEQLLLPWGLP